MKILKNSLLALAWVVGLSMGAAAHAERGACKGDIEKFCKDVQQGGGRIVGCLKSHEAKLSPECKARGEEMKSKAAGIREACQDDAHKLCDGVEAGHGAILKCLKDRSSEVSATCKESFGFKGAGASALPNLKGFGKKK